MALSLTVAQARALDQDAVVRLGMPSILLMENAARGVAEQVRRLGGATAGLESLVVVLCGPGNNGGDGLAAARHLGPRCEVHLLAEPDADRSPDAALQLRILRAAGWSVVVGGAPSTDRGEDPAVVWVDALFGTGLTRAIEGTAAGWVEAFNRAAGPKVCVDVPSGLDGDTGAALGPCCCADVTATFAAPKVGLLTAEGRAYAGEIAVVPLGIPLGIPDGPSGSGWS